MFGLGGTLLDEVEDEAGRDEGHGEDDADGHHRVHRRGQPGRERERERDRETERGSNVVDLENNQNKLQPIFESRFCFFAILTWK